MQIDWPQEQCENGLQALCILYDHLIFTNRVQSPYRSLFCYALLCVHSSFAIILKRRRKLVALLLLSYRCIVTINDL